MVGKAPLKDLIGEPVRHVAAPAAPSKSLRVPVAPKLPAGEHAACPVPEPGHVSCSGIVDSGTALKAAAKVTGSREAKAGTNTAAATTVTGYSPAQLQSAYNLTSATVKGGIANGAPVTVAISTPYDDPSAATDLAAYRAQFAQTPCITPLNISSYVNVEVGSGCVTKVNENNQSSPLPASPPSSAGDWTSDVSAEMDMVSAACPNCQILLVEASGTGTPDLGQSMITAENDADVILAGWYATEFSGETADDQDYLNAPGKAIVAGAGDEGLISAWPAASQFVTAVGSTTLTADTSSSRGWDETAYSGGGAACTTMEAKPSWQTDSGCQNRTEDDTAADGDPSTPVAYYDSTAPANGDGRPAGWVSGAASITAAGFIAGVYALNGLPQAGTYPSSYPYQSGNSGNFNDITSGSDGTCESSRTYLCTAGTGYDGPTGAGTPNGAAGLSYQASGSTVSVPDPGVQDFAWGDKVTIPVKGVSSDPSAAVTYSTTGLPNGLAVDPATGTITGTIPDSNGTSQVTVTATDSDGASGSTTFSIVSVRTMGAGSHQISGHVTVTLGGLCMNDANAATAAGSPIETYTCGTAATENWTFLPTAEPGGAGTLALSSNTGLCLTATGVTVDAKTVLDACNGSAGQKWSVQDGPQLYNPVSGHCLTVPGNSTANNTQLVIGGCADATSQQWTLPASGVQSGVGGCMDDYQQATANNTKVDYYTCNGAVSQDWTLGTGKTLQVQGVCLDMTKGSTLDGGLAELFACNGGTNQEWSIGPDGEIINVNSGKCLDDPGDTTTLGTQLQQQDCYGQPGELWQST